MKKIYVKKFICCLTLMLVLLTPTIAYAASYDTTFNFCVSIQGPARSYNNGNISLTIKSTEQKNGSVSGITTFSVALYKKGFISSTLIGSFNAKRSGTTYGGWTNMAKGNYYFYLSKANDGARVSGSIKVR